MTDQATTWMRREIAEAPEIVARQRTTLAPVLADLAARIRRAPPRALVTCARGTSGHAATFARYLVNLRLGLLAADAPPSVSSVYGARVDMAGTLYLAISQSGRSPDLIAQAEQAAASGALTVALVNDPGSPLAQACALALDLGAGPERSVAATKSFVASLSAIVGLVAAWTGDAALGRALDRLPERLAAAEALDWSPAVEALAEAGGMMVVGRGLGLAIAQEAALKMKEAAALQAEAFSAAEIRHGPLALVGPGYPILALGQGDATLPGLQALVADLRQLGARVLAADGQAGTDQLPVLPADEPACDALLQAQALYVMIEALGRRRGVAVDQPRHLSKVTRTR